MKVALIHDQLIEFGGAERVLEVLHQVWPKAPIFTAFVDYNRLGSHGQRIKKWDIRPSWIQKIFLIQRFYSPLRFLAPLIWESFDLSDFDLVISSSGWYMSRAVITRPETVHVCYLHHPPRYLYGYATAIEWQRYLPVRIYAHVVNHFLRIYDYIASCRVDYFIANSKEIKCRIAKFYHRDSTVIYPPVAIKNLESRIKNFKNDHPDYYLCVSRLARPKHIDLAIEACQKLNLPLKIVGRGREEQYLKSKVQSFDFAQDKSSKFKVEFLGEIDDEELAKVYAGAKALLAPFEDEEFGIVVVEAQSFGVPVIAYNQGGLKEAVKGYGEDATGVLFDELSINSVISAINRLEKLEKQIGKDKLVRNCLKHAESFSEERFIAEIRDFVDKAIKQEK